MYMIQRILEIYIVICYIKDEFLKFSVARN